MPDCPEPVDDDDFDGWCCGCGLYHEGEVICSHCGGEPPWGGCNDWEEVYDPDDDESWMEDLP